MSELNSNENGRSQELASSGRRLLGAVYDYAAFALATAFLDAAYRSMVWQVEVLGIVILVALTGCNLWLLRRDGQTIGKRAAGTRVVLASGGRAPLWRLVFLRWLPVTLLGTIPLFGFGVLFFLGDNAMVLRRDRRCLHDMIAGTIVLKTEPLRFGWPARSSDRVG